MSKRNRDSHGSGIYHLVMRGHNRSYIYEAMSDKVFFLENLKNTVVPFSADILYYVLMDNHYHLIIQLNQPNLPQIMHDVNLKYSQHYNEKYHRSGSLYGSRYSSYLVKDTRYLLQLILYIANNPVKAGIVKQPSDYRWCAHIELISNQYEGTVSKSALYRLLGENYISGERNYLQLFEIPKYNNIESGIYDSNGIQGFYEKREEEQLMVWLIEHLGSMDLYERLRQRGGSKDIVEMRKSVIIQALALGYSSVMIANQIGVSQRRVNQLRG